MPRATIYVDLDCGHGTVLTRGEQFRWEKDPEEQIRCAWCNKPQTVVKASIRNWTGPVCVYCYNDHHQRCVMVDFKWGKPHPASKCMCHEQGHGDPFFTLVWAMKNPPISPEDATRKTGIILEATVEDRIKAAELIKEEQVS